VSDELALKQSGGQGSIVPPRRVTLSRLSLSEFRNHRALSLAFDPRHIVLTGHNGAGKTNLLEAVSLLAPGRGLRRAAYEDIGCKTGPGGFAIGASLARQTAKIIRKKTKSASAQALVQLQARPPRDGLCALMAPKRKPPMLLTIMPV
jgi:recombinational DNA repair ATPase RecF